MAIRKADKTYLEALLESTYLFREQLLSLKEIDYPSTCPILLLDCLIDATNILLNNIQNIISIGIKGSTPIEDIMSQASDIYDFVDYFQSQVLPIIRTSNSQRVPSELVKPFERIASSVFNNCKLLVSSVPENNYYFSDISPYIKNLFNTLSLDDVLKNHKIESQDIFHLQLSNTPPCNILSHCLLGHEIGHAIYAKNNVDQIISQLIQFDDKSVKRAANSIFTSFINSLSTTHVPQQLNLQQTKASIEYITGIRLPIITSAWAEELFSDFIGTGLFGPAFICSLSMLLLPFDDIDDCSDSHPPSRFRVQSCLSALNRNDSVTPGYGYKNLYKSRKNAEYDLLTKPWIEEVGKNQHWPSEEPYKTVYRTIILIKDKIITEAKNQLGSNVFSNKQFSAEVPLLRKRLTDWLPPNEYQSKIGENFNTSSIQAIFNSGWLSYLEDMDNFKLLFPKFTESDIRQKFYQLITKGVDLANIQYKWNTIK